MALLGRKAAAASFFLLFLAGTVAAQDENKRNLKNANLDGQGKALFHDDESFWERFVQEVSASVTPQPTPNPTPGPTPPPTPEPTPRPTPPPSPGPTRPPTPNPTPGPTRPPTPNPTPGPTRPPTPNPTPSPCFTTTTVDCVTVDGTPCADIVSDVGSCTVGDEIEVVKFLLNFCTCDESLNGQDEECSDVGSLPSGSDLVRVTCENPSGMMLFDGAVPGGAEIIIGSTGTVLPDTMICSVYSLTGELFQTVMIDTSGETNLFLKDKFGSFEVVGCDEEDCMEMVTYTYVTTNTGDVPVNIETWEAVRNGEVINLLPLAPVTQINPGQSVTVTETVEIDVCINEEYLTTVNMVGVAITGEICPATDTDFFETTVSCKVDVDITCVDQASGTECTELTTPPSICSDGDSMTEMRFRFRDCTCDESIPKNDQPDSVCTDFAPIPTGQVTITCTGDMGSALVVTPTTVSSDDAITISAPNGGIFPDNMKCELRDTQGNLFQEVNINTSGDVDLKLKDKFGSLEVEACEDNTGEILDCLAILTYTYDLQNVGTSDMDITLLERTRDGVTEALLSLLAVTNLVPGQSTTLSETDLVDLCLPMTYATTVAVEANPENEKTCYGEEEYIFEIEGQCFTKTTVECVGEDGTPCEDIVGTLGSCTVGNEIEVVKFLLNFCTCDESLNTQDGECSDVGTLPSGSGTVRVTCANPSGMMLFDGVVAGGSDITIGTTGTVLPDSMTCSVYSLTGELYQTVKIDTSGETNLFLKDKFGSFELVACDEEDCMEMVTYTYLTTNSGDVLVNIQKWEINRNGEVIDLIPTLSTTEIPPGGFLTSTETVEIDVCIDAEYLTTVTVEGVALDGEICPDTDTDFFEITVACKVDVDITCEDKMTGIACDELETPGICSDGDSMTEMRFRFRDCTCEESMPTNTQPDSVCTDIGPIPAGQVTIACTGDMGTALTVSPTTVSADDAITISAPAGEVFPDNMKCVLSNAQGTVFQEVNINTSGDVELKLKDKFGSLELEACEDVTGELLDCVAVLTYTYDIQNVGTSDMDITLLERIRDGVTEQLLSLLTVTNLVPGQSTTVSEEMMLDLCLIAEETISVAVEANPENGLTCFNEEEYTFTVIPPCDVSLTMECETADGLDCTQLTGEKFPECSCANDCVNEVIMRYTGAACQPGVDNCEDFSANGDSATVALQSGGTTFFSGVVQVGDDVIIRGSGNCLPGEVDITVLPAGSQSASQVITVDVSCSGSNTLLDEYGAFQFAGYTCGDNVPHNCYTDVEYTITTTNAGEVPFQLLSWEFVLNGEVRPPGIPLPLMAPKESFSKTEPAEVELCTDIQYAATATVMGENPEGKICEDIARVSFDIFVGSPFPSPSPSSPPTDEPSSSPSEPPSPSPSASPSAPPSPSPSASPSGTPSASPSAPPSPSPSASPSAPPSGMPSPMPSAEPSPSPSAEPSPSPSAEPSPSPSASPSAEPSPSPSASPSAEPSPSPSAPPSPSPSSSPSEGPTNKSQPPSASPSAIPTYTELCEFELDVTCIPPAGSLNCNATPPPVTQCSGRPFEMIFLFNGGGCDQSFNIQGAQNLFFCTDFLGGPPTERGQEAWILVTSLDGSTIYHSDWVEVGSLFTMYDGGNRFAANQLITIYNSADLVPANLIQSVQYHSSCSSNLFLKDRYGSIQLVVWVNEDQGTVSCFANQTFELDITIPIEIEGGPATITSLTIASNIEPQFFNLTDLVAGTVVPAGGTLQAEIQIPIDLTKKVTYQLLITVIALTRLGQICTATALTSFTAGYPLPPIFPTFAPTQAPTGTAPPTADPERVPCRLSADINCATSSGSSCRRLSTPDTICNARVDPTALTFIYTGLPCNGAANCRDSNGGLTASNTQVFLSIIGRRDVVYVSRVVSPGEFVTVSGTIDGRIEVEISTVVGGAAGVELQTNRINANCDGDLVLLTLYGALQLTAFTNPTQGYQSAIEQVTLTSVIENDGAAALVSSAVYTSDLGGGAVELLPNGGVLLGAGERYTQSTSSLLFLFDVSGQTFRFELDVTGSGLQSGRACRDSYVYSFTVAA